MIAKIENNQVTEWPILSIYSRFPHTSFPSPLTDADLPDGYVMVGVIAPPQANPGQKVVPGQPVNKNGKWVQGWDVVDLTAEEITELTDTKAAEVRAERNRLITEIDWTQTADAPVDKPAWAAYRQALRDIDKQPGFPLAVQWPEPPSGDLPPDPKMVGVEFEGVMCSATSQDQAGLTAVFLAVQMQGSSFKPTRFKFENGNELVLTLQNFQRFAAVWMSFRQSFFVAA